MARIRTLDDGEPVAALLCPREGEWLRPAGLFAGRSPSEPREGKAATRRASWAKRVAFVLSIAALSACTRTPGRVTLQFWALGREGEVVTELLPEFERRYPGVHVEVQQIPFTAAHEKILTAFAGRSLPDLAQVGNTWVPELAAISAVVGLEPEIAASRVVRPEAFFAGTWDANVVEGTTYGIPWYVDTRLLFLRTDLLHAAGIETPPRTWAAWREALDALKARSGPNRYPIVLPTDEWSQPVFLALQQGSTLLRDGDRFGALSSPEAQRGLELYFEMFREGWAPVAANHQISSVFQSFGDGTFAMYITGPWQLGEFRRRLPRDVQDDWTTSPLPAPDETAWPGLSLAGGSSLVIFDSSPHRREAWALIEFLSEPAQQIRFFELTGDLPAVRSVWDDPRLANDEQVKAFRVQLEATMPTPKIPEWEQIALKIAEHIERALRNGKTVEEMVGPLDADIDRILQKRRWILDQAAARSEP